MIQRTALAGEHGRTWYDDAAEALTEWADANGWPARDVFAAFAAGSPQTPVHRHADVAVCLLTDGAAGFPAMPCHISLWQRYLQTGRVESANPRRHRKVAAFFRALCGEPDAIPLDTWMHKVLQLSEQPTPAMQDHAERRVRAVAASLGWTPTETQAALWTAMYESSTGRKAPSLLEMSE